MADTHRILVVDDDPDIRETVADVLQDEGHTVQVASNGREALDLLRDGQGAPLPELVLLDLMMPELDGWGFLAEVERDPRLASLPVVVFSAYTSGQASVASLKVRGFVRKPLRLEELLDAITRATA